MPQAEHPGMGVCTADVPDKTFQWLLRQCDERMIVLSDTACHAADGEPANLKLCRRGEWQDRVPVETVLSMLTLVCTTQPYGAAGVVASSLWRPDNCPDSIRPESTQGSCCTSEPETLWTSM
jgi:hypothetical protein